MNLTNVYLKNQNQRAKARAEFSNRLTKLLIEKGKCSARASKLADPKFLAKLVDCSLNMARRYLLGQSIPTEANLKKISEWANVDSSWLL
jgi:transcriptional regulator with XRE-family HTH domain